MAQPRDFGFGEDETLLKESARRFFSEQMPPDRLHQLVAEDASPERSPEARWEPGLWQQMTELGWTSLAVPERAGGLGMPAVAVAGLLEEAGRAAFPSPLNVTIHSTYVLDACASDAADAMLADILEGLSCTLALTNQAGSWAACDTDVVFSNGKLNGTSYFVQDAQKADRLIVKAAGEGGIGLYGVRKGASGLAISPNRIVDLTRDEATVTFEDVSVDWALAEAGSGESVLARAEPAMITMVAADMVGAAEWQLQTTAEYARVREQFDRPIGFFQAVKHPLVDVMIAIDQARSLVYNAACALDHEPKLAEQYARMAKSAASDVAVFASDRSVQFHGGIGFTWECFVHLWFKRQMHNAVLYGDGSYQRARLAELLMDQAS